MDDNTLINTDSQEQIVTNIIKELAIEVSEMLQNSGESLYKLERKQSLYNQLILLFQRKGRKLEKTILDISKNVFISDKIKNTKDIKSTI